MKNNSRRKKINTIWILIMTLLFLSGISLGTGKKLILAGPCTVQAATKQTVTKQTTVVVRFRDTDGSKGYGKLLIRGKIGSKIKLPEVPEVAGYQNRGWSTRKNASKANYAPGKVICLRKNLNLYAVRRNVGFSNVNFFNNEGKANSAFKKLKKIITRGTYITLPQVPMKKGYEVVGWTTNKNSTSNVRKEGQEVRITKNTRFYAVYSQVVTVTLCKNDGTIYKTERIATGEYYKLPSIVNASGYTFMGWDTEPRKQTSPRYEAGEKMLITGNVKLYAVVFKRANEEDLTAEELLASNKWRWGNGGTSKGYNHIIFVGDSRTVRMQLTLEKQFGLGSNVTQDIDFICKSGEGLDWLQESAVNTLMTKINEHYSVYKPTAIIFNLGVNDLKRYSEYVTYMKKIAEMVNGKNCKLFFMSVNPVNYATRNLYGKAARREETVRYFNSTVSSGLSGTYTYIDAYSYLMANGFGMDNGGSGVDMGKDDGLHYTTKTYKRIFKYCLDYLGEH